ncbi:hypothetical protein AMS68_003918 [Peltaster fructicola]|uniref:Zn(2)-C6 fungal-type domain-containing protein n=1 Tax=Peltaster fructicola TaxID=286661 RepID=A0A6H0XUQ3_9PEZI|nr:hypothetical protein AMS68_003918 [Peltaster fructicola]
MDVRERPTPPTCNQCRLRKVRCRREQPVCSNCVKSGLACDFTTKTKRVNHTKQLANDFSQLSGRLERIDDTLARINARLDQRSASVTESSETSNRAESYNNPFTLPTLHDNSEDFLTDTTAAIQSGVSIVQGFRRPGTQEYHGPTAFTALMQHTLNHVRSLTSTHTEGGSEHGSKAIQEILRVIDAGFPSTAVNTNALDAKDKALAPKPPQHLIEAGMQAFLANANVCTPLFFDESFEQSINRIAKEMSDQARNVLYSNIIVLGLGDKLEEGDTDERMLLERLLTHCHTDTIHPSQRFRSPSTYLKLMVLMSLVAANYSTIDTFDSLVRKTCLRLKNMSVEHITEEHTPIDTEEEEIDRIFWTVYALDKQRAFLTGKACDLYLFDCAVSPIPPTTNNTLHIAKAHLMSLWEEIWIALYSVRALKCTMQERALRTAQLSTKLQIWFERYSMSLQATISLQAPLTSVATLGLELQYWRVYLLAEDDG